MILESSSSLPDADPAGGRARGTVRGCAGTRRGPGRAGAPTSTEVRHVNVPFSHPSELYPQKDGRKVRSRSGAPRSGPGRSGAAPARAPGPVLAGSSRRAPADCGAQRDLRADSGAEADQARRRSCGAGRRGAGGPRAAVGADGPTRPDSVVKGPLQEPWGLVRDRAPGPRLCACSARARVRVGRGARPQGRGRSASGAATALLRAPTTHRTAPTAPGFRNRA